MRLYPLLLLALLAPHAASNAGPHDAGRAAYEKTCIDCHAPGRSKIPAARGAPRLGDRNAWESRVAKGIPELYAKILEKPHGKQDRPHERLKTWRKDLSDAEVRAALNFMFSEVE